MSVDITRCLTDKNVNVVHNSSTDTKGYYDCHSEQRSLQTQFKLVTCWRAQGCSKWLCLLQRTHACERRRRNFILRNSRRVLGANRMPWICWICYIFIIFQECAKLQKWLQTPHNVSESSWWWSIRLCMTDAKSIETSCL